MTRDTKKQSLTKKATKLQANEKPAGKQAGRRAEDKLARQAEKAARRAAVVDREAEAQLLVVALREELEAAVLARREAEQTSAAVRALAHECTAHLRDIRARREDVEEAQREVLTRVRAVEDDLVDEADDLVTALRSYVEDLRSASRREWTRANIEAVGRVDRAVEQAEIQVRAALHRTFDGMGRALAAAEERAVDSMRTLEPTVATAGAAGHVAPGDQLAVDPPTSAVRADPIEWHQHASTTDFDAAAPFIDPGPGPGFGLEPSTEFDPCPDAAEEFEFAFAPSAPPESEPESEPEPEPEPGFVFAIGLQGPAPEPEPESLGLSTDDECTFTPPTTRNGRVVAEPVEALPEDLELTTRAAPLLGAVEELSARGAEHMRLESRRRVKDGMLLTVLRLVVCDEEGWWDIRELPARSRSAASVSTVVAVDQLVDVLTSIVRIDADAEVEVTVDRGVTVAGRRLDDVSPERVPTVPAPEGDPIRVNLGAARADGLVVPVDEGWAVLTPVLVAHLRAESLHEVELIDNGYVPILRACTAAPGEPAARCVAVLHRSTDGDPEIDRRTTAANAVHHLLAVLSPGTEPEELERVLKVGVPYVRRRAAAHPKLAPALVRAIFESGDDAMRAAAAANPAIPVAICEIAVDDRSPLVRAALAGNRDIPASAQARLSFDPAVAVRARVAASPSVGPELLARLASDPDAEVRAAVAARTDAGDDLLRMLASDANPTVCGAVAANTSTAPDVLEALVSIAAVEVLSNPSLPEPLLAAATLLASPELRAAVAGNPATPVALLKKLARDPDETVRKAVAARAVGAVPT